MKRKRGLWMMTELEFEERAFFVIWELLACSGQPKRTVRRWLHQAGVVQKNAAGAKIVTRERLESCFPELLAAIKRKCTVANPAKRATKSP